MSMQRRDFLKFGVTSVGAFGLGSALAAQSQRPRDVTESLSGTVLAVGFDGSRFPGATLTGKSSVVSEIDLATGRMLSQKLVAVPNLHLALRVPGVGDVVLPLDGPTALALLPQGATQPLQAPTGFLFSGHGLLSPDGRYLYLTVRRVEARNEQDTGGIMVVEVPSLRMVALWDSGGVRPHDMAWHKGRHLLVSHYGDMVGGPQGKWRRPRLVTIDTATGAVVSIVDTPAAGSLTHIAYDGERFVCGVPLHYFPFDDSGLLELRQTLGPAVEVSPAEKWENRLAAPMPVLIVDRTHGEVIALTGDPVRQRRAQSVIYHHGSRSFWITYSFSDVLARVDVDSRTISYLSGFDLGLTSVRGLCPLGDGKHVAVSGELNGLAIVDAVSCEVVQRIMAPLYDNPHLTFVA